MELTGNTISLLPYDHRDAAAVFPARGLGEIQKAFREFFDRPWAALTYNGRGALDAVMRSLSLVRDDEVFITTTFDYPNVSSCVTSTIFNYCKPARVLSDRSKAILVIHEFGVPHRNTPQLRELADQRGIPLIEDCAHTIDSRRDDWQVGFFGDFVIVSFSKIFPVPLGGMLLGKEIPCVLTDLQEQAVTKVLAAGTHTLDNWAAHAERRREVFRLYQQRGVIPLFEIDDTITPWFFPMETPRWESLIHAARQEGVDCGRWHGTEIVVFPCHQYLGDDHVHRAADVINKVLSS